jgi:Domain of unknown function (DUF3854)
MKIPDDLTRLKGGVHPVAAGDQWTPDSAVAWIIGDLEKSGITPATAAVNHLAYTGSRDRIGQLLNRHTSLPGGTCLVIPYFDEHGKPLDYCRLKPGKPRQQKRDGERRDIKYESPSGCPAQLYIPPTSVPRLADVGVQLVLTEGEKKALALNQHGFLAVAVAGVWNLLKKIEGVETGKAFDDYEFRWPQGIPVAGRELVLIFDSDTKSKENLPLAVKYIRQHLAALEATVRLVNLPDGPNGDKVGVDDFLVSHGAETLRALITGAGNTAGELGQKTKGSSKDEKDPSVADLLTRIGTTFDLWHDPEERAFASVGRRTYAVRSKSFKTLLVSQYREVTGGKVANSEALGAALLAIEGIAVHDRPEFLAHVRVAEHDGRVYVHLADAEDTVMQIGADGWREFASPPGRFFRPRGMRALPRPRPGGRLDNLRRFLNVPDDTQWALIRAWLAMCFRENGPFPALVLLGEQGSAKTTTARVLRRSIDPRELAVRSQPKDVRDLMIASRGNWLLSYDNLSSVPDWLSDALCRLATGGGFGTRELYSDDEETTFNATRPVILNGIEDIITRADLLERSLLIHHPSIPEERRRPEAELWTEFDACWPDLLGTVFDEVAGGLRELPNVNLARLPRMADFARFAVGCETGRAEGDGLFLVAYMENQAGANEQVLDESLVAVAVKQFMAGQDEWRGTATDLLNLLKGLVAEDQRKDSDWPKKPNGLSNKLKRLAPSLRRATRIDVRIGEKGPDRKRTRLITIRRLTDISPDGSSAPSGSSSSDKSPPQNESHDRGADRPPTVLPSSDVAAESPQKADSPDDADGADDSPRTSLERPADPPVKPTGKRRKGRL